MSAKTITIDNTTYHVRIDWGSMRRGFEVVQGRNFGVSIAGTDIPDVLGVGFSYSMTVRRDPEHPSDYDSLYSVIASSTHEHQVTLPFGQSEQTFYMKVTGGTDTWKGRRGGMDVWDDLQLNFIYTRPVS